MAKAKAAPATPNYLKGLDLSNVPQINAQTGSVLTPQQLQQIQQYYQPGTGGFQSVANQAIASGDYVPPSSPYAQAASPAAPFPAASPQQPISYPIMPTQPLNPYPIGGPVTGNPAPIQPPPPPPPPAAKMDWSGLAGQLQGMLAPYLSGQASPGAGGNPMAQFMPALMSSLGGYLGQLQPTMEGQQAAANQTAAPGGPTAGGTMNWQGLQQLLQGAGGAMGRPTTSGGQGLQGQLMNQLLGYLGTMPQTQQSGTPNIQPTGVSYNNVAQRTQPPPSQNTMPYYSSGGQTGAYPGMTPMGAMSGNMPSYQVGGFGGRYAPGYAL